MNKKGFIFKFLILFFLLAAMFIIFVKLSSGETIIEIVNVTLTVNSSDIAVNISDIIYQFNNTAAVISIQQNLSVDFDSNISILSFLNASNITVVCPSEIDLSNSTKEEFFNHYITTLSGKIEESSNKVAQDVIFQLAPTKAELDDCKQLAFNASLKEQEAYRQRDKVAADNIALGSVLENTRSEKKNLQVIFWSFIGFIIISASVYVGIWERKGRLFS